MLAPHPTPKLEDHPVSAVHDCLFNLFTATLHIGNCPSIRNLRTRLAVVTGTLKHGKIKIYRNIILCVVLYGCETWSLTLREEHRLRVCENRVLIIFGPKRDENRGMGNTT